MASKVKKGFLYYLVWILVIVLGVFCILASILIFNPGKDVLGLNLKYVADSQSYNVNQIDVGGSKQYIKQLNINNINFDSGFTSFKVTQNNDYEQITILIRKNISGFTSSNKLTHKVEISYASGTLNINVAEPELSLGFSQIASVTICCPATYSFESYNFNIKTVSGSINLGNKGLYTPKFGSVNIETDNGAVLISETCDIKGETYINSKTSNIDIDANLAFPLNIETDSSKVEIDEIRGDLNITAKELKSKCNKILGNVKFSSLKGYIEIQELGNIEAKTNGNFSAIIDSMHIANVIIKKMAGSLDLPTAKQSDITIGEIYGTAYAKTTSGQVNISKAYSEIDITTDSGAVNVTQMSTQRTYIETSSGKIAINFANIGTKADLITNSADISVNLKEDLNAYIDYTNAKGISVSWIKSELEKNGFIQTPEYNESTATIFNIETKASGNIYIKNTYKPN